MFKLKVKKDYTSDCYYVVYKGHQPGIYKTWKECKKQIDKYNGAIYKKIFNEKDAIQFLREGPLKLPRPLLQKQKKDTENNEKIKKEEESIDNIFVYTDGGCILRKPSHLSTAGYGIYIPSSNTRVSKPLLNQKITNNRAELTAILEAIHYLNEEELKKKICIFTDSQYCIYLFEGTGERYEKNNYQKDGVPVPNIDLIQKLLILKRKYKMELFKVRSHTGLKDEHSMGNEIADKLASEGMNNKGKYMESSDNSNLIINFSDDSEDLSNHPLPSPSPSIVSLDDSVIPVEASKHNCSVKEKKLTEWFIPIK